MAALRRLRAPMSLGLVIVAAGLVTVAQTATGGEPRVRVFAAASLTEVFPRIDSRPRFEFAGSDVLQTQIQHGAPADVFASASPRQAQALYRDGLVERPVSFATNELVVIVPKRNPARIHSIYDLRRRGVTLVVGDASVPVGAYTRLVLMRLRLGALLSHVKSNATDVKQVVTQVALGQADAGFAYATDAKASAGRLIAIAIPRQGQPQVRYEIAVVKAGNRKAASRFITQVLSARGRALLRAAGFGVP